MPIQQISTHAKTCTRQAREISHVTLMGNNNITVED